MAASTALSTRLGRVADELHVRLRLEHLYKVFETVLVLELDKVLGLPGHDDVYLHEIPIGAYSHPEEVKLGLSDQQQFGPWRPLLDWERAREDSNLRPAD